MDPKDRLDCLAFFWKTKHVPDKQKILIEVNHINHPHMIFFNIIDDSYEEVFMPLMENLKAMYRGNKVEDIIPISKLRIGLPCVVRHENVCFRGVIINKTSEYIKVRTVDYGKDVTVTTQEDYEKDPVYWLSRSLAAIPIQGIAGGLKFLVPKKRSWTQEATEMLMDILQDREVNAVIIDKGVPGGIVDFCLECPETGENIELQLVRSGLADFIGETEEDQSESNGTEDSEDDEVSEIRDVDAVMEDAAAGEPTSLFSRAITALDCETTASSYSDDDLDISVHVYSSDDGESVGAEVEMEDDIDVQEVVKEAEERETDEEVNDDHLDENFEGARIFDTERLAAPSETMTSVSMVGRLSNVNIGAIRDNVEREKMKQEIVLEMQSLQQRLAELNCILSSEDEAGASSTPMSADALEFVPRAASQGSFELRPEADVFVPSASVDDSSSRCSTELRPDADVFVPSTSVANSTKTSPLRVDAASFTPMSHETKEEIGDENRGLFRPDAKEFVPRATRYSDTYAFSGTPLYQTTTPTTAHMDYYPRSSLPVQTTPPAPSITTAQMDYYSHASPAVQMAQTTPPPPPITTAQMDYYSHASPAVHGMTSQYRPPGYAFQHVQYPGDHDCGYEWFS